MSLGLSLPTYAAHQTLGSYYITNLAFVKFLLGVGKEEPQPSGGVPIPPGGREDLVAVRHFIPIEHPSFPSHPLHRTRAGYSRADQFYASYPAGTELLTDTSKLYKAALGNVFEAEEWGPIEFCIMEKHFERQGKSPYAYHAKYMAHLLSLGQLDGSG